MRSLPPPISTLLRVLLLAPLHVQAELGERLVERRQVPVALGVGEHPVAVEDEGRHAGFTRPFPRCRTVAARPVARSTMCWRTSANSDGGSHLSRSSAFFRNARLDFMNSIFSAVEMFTFAQPREIRSANCASVMPLPPCSAIGVFVAATRSVTRWKSSSGVCE